jgi:hypothetical protein
MMISSKVWSEERALIQQSLKADINMKRLSIRIASGHPVKAAERWETGPGSILRHSIRCKAR